MLLLREGQFNVAVYVLSGQRERGTLKREGKCEEVQAEVVGEKYMGKERKGWKEREREQVSTRCTTTRDDEGDEEGRAKRTGRAGRIGFEGQERKTDNDDGDEREEKAEVARERAEG